MKFEHLITAFVAEPWAIQREKLGMIADVIVARAEGEKLVSSETAAAIADAREREVYQAGGSVAVIPVFGVLSHRTDAMSAMSGATSYAGIKKSLHAALGNDEVKAVVLDIDSPGGAVPGTEELASEIRRLRGGDKPIIAQVNHLAASAAYWIATAADEIVVSPSGRAGSIGVYLAHDDVSEALAKRGIKRTYIAEGKYKVEGNETEPLGEEALAHLRESVRYSYDTFVSAVAEGRGVTRARVEDSFGQGRVYRAQALLDRGMVDRIGALDDTLERFGANAQPSAVRRIKALNDARREAANLLGARMAAGERITKREFESGLKGLLGLSNSEAERAARLYLKDDQGDPDVKADAAAIAAINKLIAEANSFSA